MFGQRSKLQAKSRGSEMKIFYPKFLNKFLKSASGMRTTNTKDIGATRVEIGVQKAARNCLCNSRLFDAQQCGFVGSLRRQQRSLWQKQPVFQISSSSKPNDTAKFEETFLFHRLKTSKWCHKTIRVIFIIWLVQHTQEINVEKTWSREKPFKNLFCQNFALQ